MTIHDLRELMGNPFPYPTNPYPYPT